MPVTHGVASSSLVRTANKREQRGFDVIEASLVFYAFPPAKKYDYLLLVVSEDRLTTDNLSPFTVNYAKLPNFQIIAYFCRCEHFEIK